MIDIIKIRKLLREVIRASPSYMSLEHDRELIQKNVLWRIKKRVIKNDKELQHYFRNIIIDPLTAKKSDSYELAVTALRSVPWKVWEKLSHRV